METSPISAIAQATGKRPGMFKPHTIQCLGYYRYDRKKQEHDANKVEEGDIFAAVEDQALYCDLTGEPIETSLFDGELYKSKTAPNLCLAADLANMKAKMEHNIETRFLSR